MERASSIAPVLMVLVPLRSPIRLQLQHPRVPSLPTDYVMLLVLSPLLPEKPTPLPRRNAQARLLPETL